MIKKIIELWEIYFKPNFLEAELRKKIAELESNKRENELQIKKLKADLVKLKVDNKEEEYWNNKWQISNIIYKAQDGLKRDVRNLLVNKSHILKRTAGYWRNLEPEEIAYKALTWVMSNIQYKGDLETHKATEFWQHPEETYQTKVGDCEDGSLLITSLMRIAGCPAYRVKVCAGWVKSGESKGGHAYTIFLRDDNTWCILDWCYWPNKKAIKERLQVKEEENYYGLWFTFNDIHSWSQKNVDVDKEFNK